MITSSKRKIHFLDCKKLLVNRPAPPVEVIVRKLEGATKNQILLVSEDLKSRVSVNSVEVVFQVLNDVY